MTTVDLVEIAHYCSIIGIVSVRKEFLLVLVAAIGGIACD
jgi:hypothetical protein